VNQLSDLEGLYYVEASQPLPQPGGSVFNSDGRLIGIVVMHTGNRYSGLLASTERLSILAGQRDRNTVFSRWTRERGGKWRAVGYASYMRGQVALWQGQPGITLNLLEDHVSSLPDHQASISVLLGEAYLAMDLLPEAIVAFKSAIDLGSPPAHVFRQLSWAYMETGQYGRADSMGLKAILIDPECSSGYTLLARLRNLQGDFKQAIFEARRALVREPDCPCAYFERGRGYIGLARYGDGIESLKQATTLDPMYGEAFNSLGYAYLRDGKPLHAIVMLREAVDLEPEMAAAWDNLGEAYSSAGLHDKALSALRLSICLDPSRSHAYCRLARELMKSGRYADAVEILQQGIDQCDGSQWLSYYLGKIYCHDGRIDLARQQADLLLKDNKELARQLLRIIDHNFPG